MQTLTWKLASLRVLMVLVSSQYSLYKNPPYTHTPRYFSSTLFPFSAAHSFTPTQLGLPVLCPLVQKNLNPAEYPQHHALQERERERESACVCVVTLFPSCSTMFPVWGFCVRSWSFSGQQNKTPSFTHSCRTRPAQQQDWPGGQCLEKTGQSRWSSVTCVYVCVFGGHPNRTLLEFQCQQFGNVIPFDLLLVMRPSNSVVLTDKISRLKGFVCVGGGRGVLTKIDIWSVNNASHNL